MWYVIQVINGREDVMRERIERMVPAGAMQELLYPQFQTEIKVHGEWVNTTKPLFPGYLICDTAEPRTVQQYLLRMDDFARVLSQDGQFVPLAKEEVQLIGSFTVISNLILSGKPIMVGRFGSQEARATAWALGVAKGYDKAIPLYVQKRMAVGPGFFPADDEHIRRFGLLMAKSAADLDALAYWDSFMQQWLLKEVCAEGITISYLENLEPYRNQGNPWTVALSGKRVLVVHPFAKSIEAQYSRKEQLFANRNLLPDFELQTLVPPQTIAGSADARYTDWFDALKHLEFEVDSREFDVAIIGCGAYGFPLASHVKRSGRQAIHGGGMVQMLFGIKGKRWDLKPISKELYNSSWIRPSMEERPEHANEVENGCYW